MVLYQSALMADGANFRAANELGVVLAENGDWVHARNLFAHSVRISPHPATLRNLAIVHAKLGETQLAEQAMHQSLAMERAGHRRNGPSVQWVDPVTFASSAPASDAVLPPVAQSPAGAAPVPGSTAPEAATAGKERGSWFPWSFQR